MNFVPRTVDRELVSVIIPAYNAEKYIEEAVESALNQTYKNIEILIVNDGSSDGTIGVIRKYYNNPKVKILHHENYQNLGVSKTRQLGVSKAKGKYIAFLDADDICLPERLQLQVDAFHQFENIVLCHTGIIVKSELEKYPNFEKYFSISLHPKCYYLNEQNNFLKSNYICNSTTLVKADILKNIIFSSPQLFQYEDWLLWILLSAKGKFLFLPEKLVKYRYHSSSATSSVISQPLRDLYSKTELYLSIITKLDDLKLRDLIISELREILIELAVVYSNNSETGVHTELVYEFILKLFDRNAQNPSFSQEIGQKILQDKINLLESQISSMQRSKIWRLRNKISSLRKFIQF